MYFCGRRKPGTTIFWESLLMQLLHLVWLNVVVPEGLWWEGAALRTQADSRKCKTLRCGEWVWRSAKKNKKRTNRRNKGFGEVGGKTTESKSGREVERWWEVRGKVMMLLWRAALDTSVPLCTILCPCVQCYSHKHCLHCGLGWDCAIDTQTMSMVQSDSTLPRMLQLLMSFDLRYLQFSFYCDNWCLQVHKATVKRYAFSYEKSFFCNSSHFSIGFQILLDFL